MVTEESKKKRAERGWWEHCTAQQLLERALKTRQEVGYLTWSVETETNGAIV